MPQWVIDEAQGRAPQHAVPFRAAPEGGKPGRKRGRRTEKLRTVGILVTVVAVIAVLTQFTDFGSGSDELPTTLSDNPRRDYPPPGLEEKGRPLGEPEQLQIPSTTFRFSYRQEDRTTPVTWSPCRPIHYVVRPDHAVPGGAQLIKDGFATLSQVSGLKFVYDGETDEAPSEDRRAYQPKKYGDRWAPVLVTWATADEVPDFGVDIAGEAGPDFARTRDGSMVNVSGTVALDGPGLATLQKRYGPKITRSVILHELGHLVGLAHVNDKTEIMAPRAAVGVSEYQPGDRAGLSVLGSGSCRPDV